MERKLLDEDDQLDQSSSTEHKLEYMDQKSVISPISLSQSRLETITEIENEDTTLMTKSSCNWGIVRAVTNTFQELSNLSEGLRSEISLSSEISQKNKEYFEQFKLCNLHKIPSNRVNTYLIGISK